MEDTLSFATTKGKGSAFSEMGPPYAALASAVCKAYTALNVTMTATKNAQSAVWTKLLLKLTALARRLRRQLGTFVWPESLLHSSFRS